MSPTSATASGGSRIRWSAIPIVLGALICTACFLSHGQRYHDFTITTPIVQDRFLILGFLGGRESWDNEKQGVRKLALKLHSAQLPAAVETVENKKRDLALHLIVNAFDHNRDGMLGEKEKKSVRLILYGQSFGGAAVVKLARQLQRRGVPVHLTIQIDSVGRGDGLIPPNVRRAANLFQSDGMFVRGEREIRAEDPDSTEVIGNFEFDYSNKKINLSDVNWFKRLFRTAHTKMEKDPEVWRKVEELILESIARPRSDS